MKLHTLLFPILLTLVLVTFYARPVRAANAIVGDGTAASCTESAFDAAWAQLYNDYGGNSGAFINNKLGHQAGSNVRGKTLSFVTAAAA